MALNSPDCRERPCLDRRGTLHPDGTHAVDEYVHLAGRPVLVLRRLFTAKDNRVRWTHELRDFSGSQCQRHDEPGRCEPHAIVTDVIGKPVLTLDTVGRISGVMEYDPGGLVNRATHWGEFTHTPHEWCWWVSDPMKVAGGGLAPLTAQMRTRMPRVAQSTNSCVGQFKLSAGGIWTQEPNAYWECGPRQQTVMPWATMNDNDLMYLKFCSWDGVPQNPQPLGISLEGFEYRKYEPDATPYIVPLRFPGQYFDEETEFHENWNRYYDPSTARYLSPEPLLQQPTWVASQLQLGQQVPAYAYARNNSISTYDPDGLQPVTPLPPVPPAPTTPPQSPVQGGTSPVAVFIASYTGGHALGQWMQQNNYLPSWWPCIGPGCVQDSSSSPNVCEPESHHRPPRKPGEPAWFPAKGWDYRNPNGLPLPTPTPPRPGGGGGGGLCAGGLLVDNIACSGLATPAARQRCYESAQARYAACIAGRPQPTLVLW
jgi:RHS repeat-associated protein